MVQTFLGLLILLLGSASYVVGLYDIAKGKFTPSVFSRAIWLLLSVISFGGVLKGGGTETSILLAGVFLAGNALICAASIWRGTRKIGVTEIYCLAILIASGIIWVVFDAPLISLIVSLLAHFIGGIPTYVKVWKNPKTESAGFWSLFFFASILTIISGWGEPLHALIFPIYFVIFDGALTLLALRKTTNQQA